MIDIHNHIIYGVDDGSRSLDESLKMVELFMDNGFNEIIATSHYDPSRYMVKKEEILGKSSILNDEIKKGHGILKFIQVMRFKLTQKFQIKFVMASFWLWIILDMFCVSFLL